MPTFPFFCIYSFLSRIQPLLESLSITRVTPPLHIDHLRFRRHPCPPPFLGDRGRRIFRTPERPPRRAPYPPSYTLIDASPRPGTCAFYQAPLLIHSTSRRPKTAEAKFRRGKRDGFVSECEVFWRSTNKKVDSGIFPHAELVRRTFPCKSGPTSLRWAERSRRRAQRRGLKA